MWILRGGFLEGKAESALVAPIEVAFVWVRRVVVGMWVGEDGCVCWERRGGPLRVVLCCAVGRGVWWLFGKFV